MKWRVLVKKLVERQVRDLPERIRFQVASKIANLAETPFPTGTKKLKGPGSFFRLLRRARAQGKQLGRPRPSQKNAGKSVRYTGKYMHLLKPRPDASWNIYRAIGVDDQPRAPG